MGDVVLHVFNPRHAALFIEADLHLGEIEFQRARFKPQPPDALREGVRVMQHLFDGTRRQALENLQYLTVGEAALGTDHRGVGSCLQHAAILRDEKFHAFRQPIQVRFEGTEFVA